MDSLIERGRSFIKESIEDRRRHGEERFLGKELYEGLFELQLNCRELDAYAVLIEEVEGQTEAAGLSFGRVINSVLGAVGERRVTNREAELGAKHFKDLARGTNYWDVRRSINRDAEKEGLNSENIFHTLAVIYNPSGVF